MSKPVCVIAGVGSGNGTAFAKRFASQGYAVALLARSEDTIKALEGQLNGAKAYSCDLTQEADINTVFGRIRKDLGPVTTLIYNAGGGHFKNIDLWQAERAARDGGGSPAARKGAAELY